MRANVTGLELRETRTTSSAASANVRRPSKFAFAPADNTYATTTDSGLTTNGREKSA